MKKINDRRFQILVFLLLTLKNSFKNFIKMKKIKYFFIFFKKNIIKRQNINLFPPINKNNTNMTILIYFITIDKKTLN